MQTSVRVRNSWAAFLGRVSHTFVDLPPGTPPSSHDEKAQKDPLVPLVGKVKGRHCEIYSP